MTFRSTPTVTMGPCSKPERYSASPPAGTLTVVAESGTIMFGVPQVRRVSVREPRQDLAGSSAKRCLMSLRGAWGTLLSPCIVRFHALLIVDRFFQPMAYGPCNVIVLSGPFTPYRLPLTRLIPYR